MLNLERLASEMVGDGGRPNVFFVSSEHRVEAVFLDQELALKFYRDNNMSIVEDRQTGVVENNPRRQLGKADEE